MWDSFAIQKLFCRDNFLPSWRGCSGSSLRFFLVLQSARQRVKKQRQMLVTNKWKVNVVLETEIVKKERILR